LAKNIDFSNNSIKSIEDDIRDLSNKRIKNIEDDISASLLTRQIFADAQLSFVVLNCAVIGAFEILARLCIFWLNVFARGTELQRINTLTLDELLLLHDRMRYGIDVYSGYMMADQVSETTVYSLLRYRRALYVRVPVGGEADARRLSESISQVSLSFAMQIISELVVDVLLVHFIYRGFESLSGRCASVCCGTGT
jgi:hypothetical protein